jgi:hypothetical protein
MTASAYPFCIAELLVGDYIGTMAAASPPLAPIFGVVEMVLVQLLGTAPEEHTTCCSGCNGEKRRIATLESI